nr:ORF7 [Mute swan feces associated gammacoronavirus]
MCKCANFIQNILYRNIIAYSSRAIVVSREVNPLCFGVTLQNGIYCNPSLTAFLPNTIRVNSVTYFIQGEQVLYNGQNLLTRDFVTEKASTAV